MNKVDPQLAKEIAGIRNSISRSDRTDYVTTYTEKEFFNNKTTLERVLILRTRGCSWSYHSGCSMCGYWDDTNPEIGKEELENQINSFLKEHPKGEVLKIFTSGSFFDPIEIDSGLQLSIIERVLQGYDHLIVESRPEYIRKVVGDLKKFGGRVQVAIGLESTDPSILKNSVNKNYDFGDFKEAAMLLRENGISVRTYLLLKPPFMTESEAIRDSIKSARELAQYSDFISINPMNIQRGTLVERMYKEGNYRPPWLWSVV
ncbi:MAG: archaeosine biosynthesis radical SAM protein RaSEA, partial [Candidatus Thermoplasmatota archaeon]|nr:archaeosine biosynthesis radical SAM protein RaSEA [Candidatus Thermoplasmatota archaeon]